MEAQSQKTVAVKRGFNVGGTHALPAACNLLGADYVFVTGELQMDIKYCNQFKAERVLWLTRGTDPRNYSYLFTPNGKTMTNIWNEEEWWSKNTPNYFSAAMAIPRLIEQVRWVDEVDSTAIISVQVGVQWNCVGWAPKFNREEWFAPIWSALPQSTKDRISTFNVHFYEPNGSTNMGQVVDFLTSVRQWMDRNGAANKEIMIGEIGLDKALSPLDDPRTISYPKRLFKKLEAKNAELGLNVTSAFIYCAGAYPSIDAKSQYVSLVEFGKPSLTPYGQSFADRS